MKSALLLVALLSCLPTHGATPSKREASSLTTYSTQVVPMFIVGDGWSQRLIFHNVDDRWSSAARISFYTQTGQPFPVELQNIGTVSTYTLNVGQGRTVILDLVPKFSSQQLGWARLEQFSTSSTSGDFSGLGDLFGQIIFRKQSPGLPDFMCSMVLGGLGFDKTTTYFDNTNGNFTGMEILTSDTFGLTSSIPLRVTIRDLSGAIISQKTVQQRHSTLYWMNLAADFPETANRVGTFEVESGDALTYLSAFSLQFSANGAFTIVTPFEQ